MCKTPLLYLGEDYLPYSNRFFIKAEYMQPTHSAKYRCVKAMLEAYIEQKGNSLRGKTVIESTSGNTGMALAYFGRIYDYSTLLIVDKLCPEKKIASLKAMGAEVQIPGFPDDVDPRKYRIDYVKQVARKEGYIWLNQYRNDSVLKGHISCAREIAQEITADYCFVAVGTGATLRGILDGMRIYSPRTVCVGVEPYGSCALSLTEKCDSFLNFGPGYYEPAPYLQGIKITGCSVCDAFTLKETEKLYRSKALEAGLSTGMCVRAAVDFILENDIHSKNFVILAADGREAYCDILKQRR